MMKAIVSECTQELSKLIKISIYWNLLQSFEMKTLVKSGVNRKNMLGGRVFRHKSEASVHCED